MKCRVVNLRVMREENDSRVTINPQLRDNRIGPFGIKRYIGKTFWCGKSRPRINDDHIMTELACHRHQRLRDMDCTDTENPQGWCLHADKILRAALFHQNALAGSQREIKLRRERVGRQRGRINQALCAIGNRRDQ